MSSSLSSKHEAIRPLPPDVAAQIKSSTSITSLKGVIIELIKNSLDAGAHRINVSVDFQKASCSVEDNGVGIPPAEFQANGGLAKMQHSSKLDPSQETYGNKGCYLAYLSSLSLLFIASRYHSAETTSAVSFHNGRPISRLIHAPSHHDSISSRHGTTVIVNDLFGNMPVRVKHRAQLLGTNNILEKEWEDLKRRTVGLSLAYPHPIKLVVHDENKQHRFTLHSGTAPRIGSPTPSFELSRVLDILSNAGYISSSTRDSWVLVSACSIPLSIRAAVSLTPVPTRNTQFISFDRHPVLAHSNSNVLYDEVNRLFMDSNFGTLEASDVDEEERKRRQNDKRYKRNGHTRKQLKGGHKGIERWPMFYIRISMHIDRPNLLGSSTGYLESEQSLHQVLETLRAMMLQFLHEHHFRPSARKRRRIESTERPKSRPVCIASNTVDNTSGPDSKPAKVSNPDSRTRLGSAPVLEDFLDDRIRLPLGRDSQKQASEHFGSWSRVKCSRPGALADISTGLPRSKSESSMFRGRKALDNGQEASVFTDKHQSPIVAALEGHTIPSSKRSSEVASFFGNDCEQSMKEPVNEQSSSLDIDAIVVWIDPVTKAAISINGRTGTVLPPLPSSYHNVRPSLPARPFTTGSAFVGKELSRPASSKSDTCFTRPKPGSWFGEVIGNWDNPVFEGAQAPIPSVVAIDDNPSGHLSRNYCLRSSAAISNSSSLKLSGRFSKTNLDQATVIGQVDQKFILVRLPTTSREVGGLNRNGDEGLVLVDQHAADERCRIEKLLGELFLQPTGERKAPEHCIVQTSILPNPIRFNISAHENSLFLSNRHFFSTWGITYTIETPAEIRPGTSRSAHFDTGADLIIKSLPTLIASRCIVEPKVAINLLRTELWNRNENPVSMPTTATPQITSTESEGKTWVRHISSIPRTILDLLNSRACRSAIMFNDVLAVDECEALMKRLSKCTFPWFCAHGRPSLVSLVGLGSNASDIVTRNEESGLLATLDSAQAALGNGCSGQDGCGKPELDFRKAWMEWERKDTEAVPEGYDDSL